MATEKISLSLEEDLVSEARATVGIRGLSNYVNSALRDRLQRDRVTALLAEYEEEFGPIDSQVMEEVKAEWPQSARKPRGSQSA
jgi:Arc/MetJ family transcription regulator